MSTPSEADVLHIHTVDEGFYEGFNPIVTMITKLLVVSFVIALVAFPLASGEMIGNLREITLLRFGNWYIYIMAAFVWFCGILVALPISGRIKLGGENDIPDHSTASWLSMMFCSGIGVGILVFSISEPISHFITNPASMAADRGYPLDRAASALSFVFLHWGFSAWCSYALVGLALGLACHRNGHPMTMRSALVPLIGKSLEGPLGHVVDIISILALLTGITTTIVLGLDQICSGLSALTGSSLFADSAGNPPLTALLTALVFAVSIAIGSVISGVERGVKWMSNLGMALAFGVLGVFALHGSLGWMLTTFIESTIVYFRSIPAELTRIYSADSEIGRLQSDWQGGWTIFYWAWWIAFAPFVGLFLARISRGRTLREFILGAVVGPTLLCFLWFSVLGGTAILMELDGTAGGLIIAAPHASRIYETIDLMLSPDVAFVMKAIITLLFLVLIVASSNAAIIAIKSIGAAGGKLGETPMHSMVWALVIAAGAGAVVAMNQVDTVRDVMIVGALPFSGIMVLMLLSVAKVVLQALRAEYRAAT